MIPAETVPVSPGLAPRPDETALVLDRRAVAAIDLPDLDLAIDGVVRPVVAGEATVGRRIRELTLTTACPDALQACLPVLTGPGLARAVVAVMLNAAMTSAASVMTFFTVVPFRGSLFMTRPKVGAARLVPMNPNGSIPRHR